MRVICIDAADRDNEFPYETEFKLVEGDTYTVIEEVIGYGTDGSSGSCYVLQEDPDWCYDMDRFVPLSEVGELELIKEEVMT